MKYKSDSKDTEWLIIGPLFTRAKKGKHFQKHEKRKLLNAVLYIVKTGCQWKFLLKDFPPYKTVNSFYVRARKNGLWEEMMELLIQKTRIKAERNIDPSYTLIDSQSTKITYSFENRGIDGKKKVKGRKRHIVTDIMCNILKVTVHAANIHDTVAGCSVFESALKKYPIFLGVCADKGYRKTFLEFVELLGGKCEISEKIIPKGWAIIPKRLRVERTFAWLTWFRRLSKDYEISSSSEENIVMIAHSYILLKRLCYCG